MIRLRSLRRALTLGLPLWLTIRKLERTHQAAGLSLAEDRKAIRCRAIGHIRKARAKYTHALLRQAAGRAA